jgi:hypothetical protein
MRMLDYPLDVALETGSVRACMRLSITVRLKLRWTLSVCWGCLVGGEEGGKGGGVGVTVEGGITPFM